MTDTRQIFAANLSRLLEEKGIEQQTVAMDLDVSTSIVSAWVLGKRFPRADKMQELANYFKVTVAELVDAPIPTDDDLMAIREQLRRQPEMRILFDSGKNATKQDILDAAALMDSYKKRRDGDE